MLSEAQAAYAHVATLTTDPDRAGYLLYQRAVRDCDDCRRAIAAQDRGALVQAVHHAQHIVAALHDNTRQDLPAGRAFRTSHLWVWRRLGQVARSQDPAALDEAQRFLQQMADQLRARLEAGGS